MRQEHETDTCTTQSQQDQSDRRQAQFFLAFLVAMAPRFSGMAIHEWLGIAFGAAITTHLLLHCNGSSK